jgi:hypothetical protein
VSHLLDRLELDIHMADAAQAQRLQDRLSRLHHQALAGLLSRVLDQLSPPGLRHQLERLELDLGTIPADQLELLLPNRLEQALRQALPYRLRTAQVSQHPDPVEPAPSPLTREPAQQPDNSPPALILNTPGAAEVETLPQAGTPGNRTLELLAAFAATGTLPWWAPRHDPRLIPTAFAAALRLPPFVLVPFLRQLAATPAAQQRLLASLDPEQRPLLLEALRNAPTPKFHVPDTAAPRQPSAEETPPSLLAAPNQGDASAPAGRLLELLSIYAETGTLPSWAPRHDAGLLTAAVAAALRLPTGTLNPFLRQVAAAPAAQERLLAALDASQRPQLLEALQTAALAPPTTALAPEPPGPSPLKQDDALHVDGAGLALLWPFLATLFERLEWLTPDRGFIGTAAQRRAMALLGYLVNGDSHPPEWRLTLAKLLCGLPLDAVYVLTDDLNPLELEEADKLLQAVLLHGNGLLGDDVDSLRATWLQRPGLLSWRPQAWLLAVERRDAIDGELDRLPWGVSWLRLPWMVELVQVGW